jgi:hypothetical protein
MIQITQRPTLFSSVGGVFPNPTVYLITTDAPFVEATLYGVDDSVLATVKASQRNGVARFDVSGFLRAQMSLAIPDDTLTVSTLTGSCVGYYAVFTTGEETVSDILYKRYAVFAALPYGESDYQKHTV